MLHHVFLLVTLLSLCYGFLLVLIPWKPLGFKYVLPSVIFFSFAVALSLSFIAAWTKERWKQKGFFVYLSIIIYIIFYNSCLKKSNQEKNYWIELGNYGFSIVDSIANNIGYEFCKNKKKKQYIYVEYKDNVSYGRGVLFGKLHLMRILNLEKKINLMNKDSERIVNYKMPEAETSSFIKYNELKSLYISDDAHDLDSICFDVIYKGYKAKRK